MDGKSGLVELMQRRAQLKKKLRKWTKEIKQKTGRDPSDADCENNKPMLLEYKHVKIAIEKLMKSSNYMEENSQESSPLAQSKNINNLKNQSSEPTTASNGTSLTLTSPIESWFTTTTSSFGGLITSMGIDSLPTMEVSSNIPSSSTTTMKDISSGATEDKRGDDSSWISSIWNDIPSTTNYGFGDWFGEGGNDPKPGQAANDDARDPLPTSSSFFFLGESSSSSRDNADQQTTTQPNWFTRWVEDSLRKEEEEEKKQIPKKKKNQKRKTTNKKCDDQSVSVPNGMELDTSKGSAEREWLKAKSVPTSPPPLPPPDIPPSPPYPPPRAVLTPSVSFAVESNGIKEKESPQNDDDDDDDQSKTTTIVAPPIYSSDKEENVEEEDDEEEEREMIEKHKQEINEKFAKLKDEAMLKFNLNAKKGIEFIIDQKMIPDKHPKFVGEFLFNTRGLNKTQIGEYLGDPNAFNLAVLNYICYQLFKFKDISFSAAIRKFLKTFRLPGEAQKIDRILEAFAEAYYDANNNNDDRGDGVKKQASSVSGGSVIGVDGSGGGSEAGDDGSGGGSIIGVDGSGGGSVIGVDGSGGGSEAGDDSIFGFSSPSTAHILAFSIIMLNTDAHNPSMAKKDKMTKDQFIKNNRGIDEGKDLPQVILEDIYDDITSNEILTSVDMEIGGSSAGIELFSNPTKEGWMDKMGGHLGAHLLQQWRSRYFILSGNRLYYFKEVRDINPLGCIVLVDVMAEANGASSASHTPKTGSKSNMLSSAASSPSLKRGGGGGGSGHSSSTIQAKEWKTDLMNLTQLMTPTTKSSKSGRRDTILQSVKRGLLRSASITETSHSGLVHKNAVSGHVRTGRDGGDVGILSVTPTLSTTLNFSSTNPTTSTPSCVVGKHITFHNSGSGGVHEKLGIFLKSRGYKQLPIVDDILYEIPLLKKGDVLVCIDHQPIIDMNNPISELLFKIKKHQQQHQEDEEQGERVTERDGLPMTLSFISQETESLVRKHSPLSFRNTTQASAVVYSDSSSSSSSNHRKGYLEIIPSFGGKINSVRYNEQGQVVPGTHDTVKLQLKSSRLADSWMKAINDATIHTSGAI